MILGLRNGALRSPCLPEAITVNQFCAYEEAWEKHSVKRNDPLDEEKLLEKYDA
jgi:hypothetical protein